LVNLSATDVELQVATLR